MRLGQGDGAKPANAARMPEYCADCLNYERMFGIKA